ncbi:unnamed protein product [Linum tenue]|uniref:Phytocyanin domain-containing protein n=1 Tax=Linum tenue TaxID=586396 RepID=A0AAV0MSC9_9ROSI|nr:unnamed protein product [Linum tenue]CAI0449294.1 unnamed protein product [Linum tenue]
MASHWPLQQQRYYLAPRQDSATPSATQSGPSRPPPTSTPAGPPPTPSTSETLSLFNVVQVLRHDFESCISNAPLQVFTIGPAVVELSHAGVFYYICNVSNYCDLGLRVAVVVHQRPPTAPPLIIPSSPAPLPPATTAPHPPASPLPVTPASPSPPPPSPVPPHAPISQPSPSGDVENNSSLSPAPGNEITSNYSNGANRMGDRHVIGLLLVGILIM